jgi:hypothetical protein
MQKNTQSIIYITAHNANMELIECPIVLYDLQHFKQTGLTLTLFLTCKEATLYFRDEDDLLSAVSYLENAINSYKRIS